MDPAVWKWMWEIAQQASPPVASLCLIAVVFLWRKLDQTLTEHRKAENRSTEAWFTVATSLDSLATAITGKRLNNKTRKPR